MMPYFFISTQKRMASTIDAILFIMNISGLSVSLLLIS